MVAAEGKRLPHSIGYRMDPVELDAVVDHRGDPLVDRRVLRRHHDYIDAGDFPSEWLGWPLTVEVEAKAKELAVIRLIADLHGEGGSGAG